MNPTYTCFCCHRNTQIVHPMDKYPEKKLCTTCYIDDKSEQNRWNYQQKKKKEA